MNSLTYLLVSGIILLVFTLYYYLVLRVGKNYLFNRIYLVAAGTLSFLLVIPEFTLFANREYISTTLDTLNISSNAVAGSFSTSLINYEGLLWTLYFAGVVTLVILNCVAWFKIQSVINRGKKMNLNEYNVIVNHEISDSFSFMNKVVVPNELVSPLVLKHEYAHVKGFHTFDLFFAEVVCVLLWFIPFIKTYKKAIVMNHEFIADQNSGSADSREVYCEQLLAQTMRVPGISLGHTFSNPSLTKTRIIMMYKNPMSPLRSAFSYAMIIPLIAFTLLIASCKDETQQSPLAEDIKNEKNAGTETMPEFPGGNEALMDYLINQIKYPENAKLDGVEGKVFVKFIITEEGKVRDVVVEKGVHEELDAEAVRVISFMPDWKPGVKNGKNISTHLTLPIMFSLQ